MKITGIYLLEETTLVFFLSSFGNELCPRNNVGWTKSFFCKHKHLRLSNILLALNLIAASEKMVKSAVKNEN